MRYAAACPISNGTRFSGSLVLRKQIDEVFQPHPATEGIPPFSQTLTFPLPASEFFPGLHALFAPVLDVVSLPGF